jgi:hypothetical protein
MSYPIPNRSTTRKAAFGGPEVATVSLMAEIQVRAVGEDVWLVQVREGASSTQHRVTARADERQRLGASVAPDELIRESFRFLLEREPKESILARFDLTVIGRYFPEYPDEIKRRLGTAD